MKKTMKKKIGRNSQLVLLLMLVIATLTGFGLYSYLNTQKIPVYLYTADYKQGESLKDIRWIRQDMDISTYNALGTSGVKYASANDIAEFQNQGDRLAMDVSAYTPCITSQMVSSGGTELESRLGKNMVAAELLSEVVSGLSAEVESGSRINLLSSYVVGDSKRSELLFQNLLVLEVVRDGNGNAASVYVELEPGEAVELAHSLTFETVTANILKPGSYVDIPDEKKSYEKTYSQAPVVTDYWNQDMSDKE